MPRKQIIFKPQYSEDEENRIAQRVLDIRERYGFTIRQARVWEVISRYEGENGLSRHKVEYLTGCILDLMEER